MWVKRNLEDYWWFKNAWSRVLINTRELIRILKYCKYCEYLGGGLRINLNPYDNKRVK